MMYDINTFKYIARVANKKGVFNYMPMELAVYCDKTFTGDISQLESDENVHVYGDDERNLDYNDSFYHGCRLVRRLNEETVFEGIHGTGKSFVLEDLDEVLFLACLTVNFYNLDECRGKILDSR